ncbi:MAG: peroxide stress protein YaaA [Oscillospiraceae bacterium]|nr:peroxide stress protein YaaA [Oscillospiraceae bacterium]
MRIILSPAKKMNVDTDSFLPKKLPVFLMQAEEIKETLRAMDDVELKKLWKCNDSIAKLNCERLRSMDLRAGLTPAVFSYEGIAYQYMAPSVFSALELAYIEEHLRILSAFYGVLRPFDGVTPYRLEMQAKLKVCEAKDLYEYWGAKIAENIYAETDTVLNLASKEYSLCVSRYVPKGCRFITCVFGEEKDGKIMEKGTLCKMARGEAVRYLAEKGAKTAEEIRGFDRLGYRFDAARSDEETYVFIKG